MAMMVGGDVDAAERGMTLAHSSKKRMESSCECNKKLTKGNRKKEKKKAQWLPTSLKDRKSYPEVRKKCLEISLLKEVKS
ncbi:hypothetical protein E2C01_043742 [Portunus trituberculatus]|uniref:Uncharacterized protein n=1 Tax=Portunus trituberculatus TaxID=210409 RepID=A0A5B7FWX5_PORTR|nr:hypothetical protein [Portunus trituberculatus]